LGTGGSKIFSTRRSERKPLKKGESKSRRTSPKHAEAKKGNEPVRINARKVQIFLWPNHVEGNEKDEDELNQKGTPRAHSNIFESGGKT